MVSGFDPAEVTALDPAEAESGVAIQMVPADSNATGATAAKRKRCRVVDCAAAGWLSAAFRYVMFGLPSG
jgi:hypothetical protein